MNYSDFLVKVAEDNSVEPHEAEALFFDTVTEMAGYGMNGYALKALVDDDRLSYQVTWEDGSKSTCNVRQMFNALLAVRDGYAEVNDMIVGYTLPVLNDGDLGMIDADLAPVIVQYAGIGSVVYG